MVGSFEIRQPLDGRNKFGELFVDEAVSDEVLESRFIGDKAAGRQAHQNAVNGQDGRKIGSGKTMGDLNVPKWIIQNGG